MEIGFALGEWMNSTQEMPNPTISTTTIGEFSPAWSARSQEPVPPLIYPASSASSTGHGQGHGHGHDHDHGHAHGSVANGASFPWEIFPWETKTLPAEDFLKAAPFSNRTIVPYSLEEPVPPPISFSARTTGSGTNVASVFPWETNTLPATASVINGTSRFPWETTTVQRQAQVLNTTPLSYATTAPFTLEETAFTAIKGAPIVVGAPEEIAAPVQVVPVQQVLQTVAPRVQVIEKVLHEKSLGLTFREVEGMMNKLRSVLMMEMNAVMNKDAKALPCELPAVGPLLEEQSARVEETLQKERVAFQEMRSGLLQEVSGKLQQTCGLLLPEMHALVQKAHFGLEEKVQATLQEALQDERSYIFGTMQDLMQQQLTTLSTSTNAEFAKLVTMINGVSTVSGDRMERLAAERMERLESSCAACTSSLNELKKDLATVIANERLDRMDISKVVANERLDRMNISKVADNERLARDNSTARLNSEATNQALIDTNMKAELQRLRQDFSNMDARVSSLASDVAGHSSDIAGHSQHVSQWISGISSISSLAADVARHSEDIAGHSQHVSMISSLAADVARHSEDIAGHSSSIAGHSQHIVTIASLAADVARHSSDIAEQGQLHDQHRQRISLNTASLAKANDASMTAKGNDVIADLRKDVESCRASHRGLSAMHGELSARMSDTLQPAHLEQHRIEHTAAMASHKEELIRLVQTQGEAHTANKEELIRLMQTQGEAHTRLMQTQGEAHTRLMQTHGEARMLLEEAVVAVSDETREIKDKVASLDKFSTELSGEVQVCAASLRRSPDKRREKRESLDRYREILSLRESP